MERVELLIRRSLSAASAAEVALFVVPALAIVAIVAGQPFFEARWMFMDPMIAGELSKDCCRFYYGAVSNLGVLMWASTAAICLFAAAVLAFSHGFSNDARALLLAGLLTGWLCVDDLFMMHEGIFMIVGIPQWATIALYLGLTVTYLTTSWRVMAGGNLPLLGLALGLFAVSAGADLIIHSTDNTIILIEDGAKFIAIAAWGGFHVLLALDLLKAWTTGRQPAVRG